MTTPGATPPDPALASDFGSLDFQAQSEGAVYHWMNGMIVPRPIAFVTSVSEEGVVNGAPFSYFNAVTASPPVLSIAVGRREGVPKDTSRNIRRSGQFVVNVCSVDLAGSISLAAGDFPADQSEIEVAGLTLLPSTRISVPRVANSPIHLECELERVVELGEGPVDLILGRIVFVHFRKDLLDDEGRIDPARLDPLARMAGLSFGRVGDFFEVPRGLS